MLFGINHHASKLVDCDYIVFNDYDCWDLVRELPGKKISRWPGRCDIHNECRAGIISGVVALEFAQKMGFLKIILAGFDCYQGDGYFHDPTPPERAKLFTLEQHISFWKKFDDPRISVVGGPLTQLFNKRVENMSNEEEQDGDIVIEVTERKNVKLDANRTVSLWPGKWSVTKEIADKAVNAKCAKIITPKKGTK